MKSPFKSSRWFSGSFPQLPTFVSLIATVLFLGATVLGIQKPFYSLPMCDEHANLILQDSWLTPYFKVALIGYLWFVLFILLIFFFRRRSPRKVLLHSLLHVFLATLVYPTLLLFLDPDSVGEGAWMQQQHDTMTWLGGDVYRAHADRRMDSGLGMRAQDPPLRLAVFRPPTEGLGLDRLDDWVSWIGYGPHWTQFFGKGWAYTVFGCGGLLVTLLGAYGRVSFPHARQLMKELAVCTLCFVSLYGVLLFGVYNVGQRKMHQAKEATAHGAYQEAYDFLRSAIQILPPLANDSSIIAQLGYYQGQIEVVDAPEYQLYHILWLEDRGYHDRARTLLRELASRSVSQMPQNCVREVARHQLRMAINDLNSGKVSACEAFLDQVLAQHPACIQALFHKHSVSLQNNDLVSMRRAHQQLHSLYRGFRSKNKRGVLAASSLLRAQAEAKAGYVREAWSNKVKSKGL